MKYVIIIVMIVSFMLGYLISPKKQIVGTSVDTTFVTNQIIIQNVFQFEVTHYDTLYVFSDSLVIAGQLYMTDIQIQQQLFNLSFKVIFNLSDEKFYINNMNLRYQQMIIQQTITIKQRKRFLTTINTTFQQSPIISANIGIILNNNLLFGLGYNNRKDVIAGIGIIF